MRPLIDIGFNPFQRRTSKRNAQLLARIFLVMVALLATYAVLFQAIMSYEGRTFSWTSAIYWTLTTMGTLGQGDITFESDIGRGFTVLVLLSGLSFIVVLFPFVFIRLFQSTARVHRELPRDTKRHVVLTHFGPVSTTLIRKMRQFKTPYVLVVPELDQALTLTDEGWNVVVGSLDDPETYRKVNADRAILIAATGGDMTNTAVSFAVRQVTKDVPLIASASTFEAGQVLHAAGATHVLTLAEMLGFSLARRTTAGDALAHGIGQFDRITIAEATASGTPLVGQTLLESGLRESTGVTVVGVWERGRFATATAETRITNRTVLVLAGTDDQIRAYNELFCIYNVATGPVLIVGGGNVGQAMGRALEARELDYRIVEHDASRVRDPARIVFGNATDPEILHLAQIDLAPCVAVTTHDDEMNIYVTTLVRHLRPDVQIISRATMERTVHVLHEAGADFVMSYASMGANSIFNMLHSGDILMVAEGVDVFRVRTPLSLAGTSIADSHIRPTTGCSIIGITRGAEVALNPDPSVTLDAGAELIIIGTVEGEKRFHELYAET